MNQGAAVITSAGTRISAGLSIDDVREPYDVLVVSGDCYSAVGGVGGAAEFLPGVEVVLDALAPGGDQA